jgi:hypothetical protein
LHKNIFSVEKQDPKIVRRARAGMPAEAERFGKFRNEFGVEPGREFEL